MNIDCPKCQTKFQNKSNPYDLNVCPSCQWVGYRADPNGGFLHFFGRWARWVSPAIIIFGFSLIAVQFVVWKKFSLDMMVLQAKSFLQIDTQKDHLERGAICNVLGKFDCSVEEFYFVVQVDPKHKKALANLAISYSKLGKWKKAKPHFDAYFSLGGHAYDVMFWYAQTLGQLESAEKSLYWYYYSLAVNPQYAAAADALVSELLRFGRSSEALSVIASMTKGLPDRFDYWKARVATISNYASRSPVSLEVDSAPPLKLDDSVNLPALDGQTYYAPIRVGNTSEVDFFVVNKQSAYLLINRDILKKYSIDVPASAARVSFKTESGTGVGARMRLNNIKLGPWEFKNIEVAVCDECQPTLGRSLLSKLELSTWNRHETSFLTLKRKE